MDKLRLSVHEFNALAQDILNANFPSSLELEGEVAQATLAASGHFYFTLKDSKANISCVMFRSQIFNPRLLPKSGDYVVCEGNAGIYQRDGRFQFYAKKIQEAGQGKLWARFEAMKLELESQGFFKPERKKALPFLPKTIGVVTSLKGAAVQDIINVLSRRCPSVQIQIISTLVQGEAAASQIAKAIQIFNYLGQADLLIVGRGGGSLEDLWAFNERVVAEAIYQSKIPIISAVGHETDFSIADFTADLRAPTPSAAAELAVPEEKELRKNLQSQRRKLQFALQQSAQLYQERLEQTIKRLDQAFLRRLELEEQHLDRLMSTPALLSPGHSLQLKVHAFKQECKNLYLAQVRNFQRRAWVLTELDDKLKILSPYRLLEKGYTLALNPDGQVVSSVQQVRPGEKLRLQYADGEVIALSQEILPNTGKEA